MWCFKTEIRDNKVGLQRYRWGEKAENFCVWKIRSCPLLPPRHHVAAGLCLAQQTGSQHIIHGANRAYNTRLNSRTRIRNIHSVQTMKQTTLRGFRTLVIAEAALWRTGFVEKYGAVVLTGSTVRYFFFLVLWKLQLRKAQRMNMHTLRAAVTFNLKRKNWVRNVRAPLCVSLDFRLVNAKFWRCLIQSKEANEMAHLW
jgi:hypothetical protein